MSTPTAVADAELAKILSDNEDYILSVTKSQAVDLSKEMFQRCVISDSIMDRFSSLDHNRVDPKLQLRHLLRLVKQRIQEDGSVGNKFLSLLESMKEYPLCEYLRSSCLGEDTVAKGTGLDRNLTSKDMWLLEDLAEASPKWEMLGIALGLSSYQIKNIKGDDNIKNLWHILDIWLSKASTAQPTTIRTLAQALRSKIVSHGKIAREIEKKYVSQERVNIFPHSNITDSSQLSLTITNQSSREVQVEDGKSTLLMVQASHRENVSYQWNKNGQPLADDYMYSGVHDNILVISHAHQGTGGEYTCCVRREERAVVSNKITLNVLYSLKKKTPVNAYNVNTQAPLKDGAWPPVGRETLGSLTLARSNQRSVDTSSIYFDKHPDRILNRAEIIEYSHVFTSQNRTTLILIEGCPDDGKTIVHKVINDFQGNALVRANFILLIYLCFLSNTSQDDTLSILNKLFTNTEAGLDSGISDLEANNGEGVCLIINESDKYHSHMGDKSVIFILLHKSHPPLAMINVCPGAMARLRQAVVRQHIEVLEFYENQILEYNEKFLFDHSSNSSSGPTKLKDYLPLDSDVFDICYLPIHAAIICFVYKIRKGHLPRQRTTIYNEFTRSMILRHLKRNNIEIQLYSVKELPEDTREYFSKLCLLAFNMTVEHKQVINERDISFPLCEDTSPRGDWSLGLVTCNRTAQLCGVSTSYMFLHLTLQEYLAAYHIANTEGEEKRKLIEMTKFKSFFHVRTLLTFYFGLETLESLNMLDVFYEQLRAEEEVSIKCTFESLQELLCSEIVSLFDGIIDFSEWTFPVDVPALEFVFTSLSNRELTQYCRF